jgi:hypothetical protein
MEHLEGVHLLAEANQFNRLSGHRSDGESCATPGIAVQFGQDDAGEPSLGRSLGHSRVLTGHCVGDQKNFPRCEEALIRTNSSINVSST